MPPRQPRLTIAERRAKRRFLLAYPEPEPLPEGFIMTRYGPKLITEHEEDRAISLVVTTAPDWRHDPTYNLKRRK